MSLARAPLFSHFGAAMQGLASIRAYSAQETFKSGASLRCSNQKQALSNFDIRVIEKNRQILKDRSPILES
jgi:hypothetical protein